MMRAKRVLNRLGRPFWVNPFSCVFPNPIADHSGSAAAVFNDIHGRVNFWGSEESHSGLGSELAFTANYRRGLARCLTDRGIRSLFHASCGDLNWMSVFLTEHPVDYAGGSLRPTSSRARKRPIPAETCASSTSRLILPRKPRYGTAAIACSSCLSKPSTRRSRIFQHRAWDMR